MCGISIWVQKVLVSEWIGKVIELLSQLLLPLYYSYNN